jgi:hypothetical protein
MKMATAPRARQQRLWQTRPARKLARLLTAGALILAFAGVISARSNSKNNRRFTYVGGNQMLLRACVGDLELKNDVLTFRCPDGAETIPYASIQLMEYRPSLSQKVRKLAPHWEVIPSVAMPVLPKKRNRFFAVVYSEPASPSGNAHILKGLVLAVTPDAMQPYIAEIELKSNKRVEVYTHEEY